jgi:hypothetical protein
LLSSNGRITLSIGVNVVLVDLLHQRFEPMSNLGFLQSAGGSVYRGFADEDDCAAEFPRIAFYWEA